MVQRSKTWPELFLEYARDHGPGIDWNPDTAMLVDVRMDADDLLFELEYPASRPSPLRGSIIYRYRGLGQDRIDPEHMFTGILDDLSERIVASSGVRESEAYLREHGGHEVVVFNSYW